MFSFEDYLPFTSFNESSLFFKASEVFRHGFLLDSQENAEEFSQLYSYHNYYVEITYGTNYEDIVSIHAISIDQALDSYVNESVFIHALLDLFDANL